MNKTLLPCPFCGGANIGICYKPRYDTCVRCVDCDSQTDWLPTISDAVAAWNRRCGKDTNVATNADRIRSMSDEELADWIDSVLNQDREDWDVPGCYSCINYGTHHSNPENKGTYLYECADCPYEGSYENGLKYGVRAWLQQPAKEE